MPSQLILDAIARAMDEQGVPESTIPDKGIYLGEGWTLHLWKIGHMPVRGFLIHDSGKRSASLDFAVATGTDSDQELPIPEAVLAKAEQYSEYA